MAFQNTMIRDIYNERILMLIENTGTIQMQYEIHEINQ